MDPHSFIARAEAQRWVGIAEKLLMGHDLVGSKTFAIRARDSDPRLEAADQILAIADTLLAAEKRVVGNNGAHQPDFYAILQLVRFVQDTEHIASQYRRLAALLNPHQNRFPYSDQAFQLVNDAWAVLSNPMRKSMYDAELDFPPPQQQMNTIGFNLEQQQHNFFSINHMGAGHEQDLPEQPQTFQTRLQQSHEQQQLQQHNFLSQPNPVRPLPVREQEHLFQPQVQPFQVTSSSQQQNRPTPQPTQSQPPIQSPPRSQPAAQQAPFSWSQTSHLSQPQQQQEHFLSHHQPQLQVQQKQLKQEQQLQQQIKQEQLQHLEQQKQQQLQEQRRHQEQQKQHQLKQEQLKQQQLLQEQRRQQEEQKQQQLQLEQQKQQQMLQEQRRQQEEQKQQQLLQEQRRKLEEQKQQQLREEQRKQQQLLEEQRKQQQLLEEQRKKQQLLEEQRKQQQLLEEQRRQQEEQKQKQLWEEEQKQKLLREEQEKQQQLLEEQRRQQEEQRQKQLLEEEQKQKQLLEEQQKQQQLLEEQRRQQEEQRQKQLREEEQRQKQLREEEQKQQQLLHEQLRQQESIKHNAASEQLPNQVNSSNGAREEETEAEAESADEDVDDSPTFWTACPYCFYMFEYPRVYAECTLCCDNCKRAFQAVRITCPPPIIDGQDAYFYCWGFIPVGVRMSHLQNNNSKGTNSKWTPFSPLYDASNNGQNHLNCNAAPKENLFVNKSSGPRIYIDDISDDMFIDVSESGDDSDFEWNSYKEQNVKRMKKGLNRGFKERVQVLALRALDVRNGVKNLKHGILVQEGVKLPALPVAETNTKAVGTNPRKQSGRVAKELGKLDLNVEFNNNEGEEPAPHMTGGNRGHGHGQGEDGFFEGLDEFLSSLPILSVVNEEKVKA